MLIPLGSLSWCWYPSRIEHLARRFNSTSMPSLHLPQDANSCVDKVNPWPLGCAQNLETCAVPQRDEEFQASLTPNLQTLQRWLSKHRCLRRAGARVRSSSEFMGRSREFQESQNLGSSVFSLIVLFWLAPPPHRSTLNGFLALLSLLMNTKGGRCSQREHWPCDVLLVRSNLKVEGMEGKSSKRT